MKQNDFETTTLPKAQPSRTGMLDGEHGSATLGGSQQGANWLAARSTAEVNRSVVSLVQQCGVRLREDIDWRGSYERPDGSIAPAQATKCGWIAAAETPAQIAEAHGKVSASMTPASESQITRWIAELSVITARREDAPETEALRLMAYRSRLVAYPADVAREALLVHGWKFFPAWAELAEVCDRLVEDRRRLKAALDRAASEAAEREARARALPTEATATQTPEEAEATRKRRATMLGDMIAEMRAKADAQRADQEAAAAQAEANFATHRPHAAE